MVDLFTILMNLLNPQTIAAIIAAALYGLFIGSMPGLTATMAVALLVPFAFWMDPLPALAMIITMDALAIYSGDIPATLIRIPGTPASAAYVQEMYEATKRGRAEAALGTGLVCSALGGIIGTIVLVLGGPMLAEFAMNFSSAEFFWLTVFGLSTAVIAAKGKSITKSALALLLGLLLSTIGVDPMYQFPRFTFGSPYLLAGINFIPAMIGLFGISEILRQVSTYIELGKFEIKIPVEELSATRMFKKLLEP